jgi:hypothetical protein
VGVEERREARVGTVSGLALLTGGTAVAAVAGGAHSVFATILLGLLTLGLGHSLAVEIKRQAGRRSAAGWSRHDSINMVLLGLWSEGAMLMTILWPGSSTLRAVGLTLSLAYAVGWGYFVTERRRAITALGLPPAATPAQPPADPEPIDPGISPGAPFLAEPVVSRGAAPLA